VNFVASKEAFVAEWSRLIITCPGDFGCCFMLGQGLRIFYARHLCSWLTEGLNGCTLVPAHVFEIMHVQVYEIFNHLWNWCDTPNVSNLRYLVQYTKSKENLEDKCCAIRKHNVFLIFSRWQPKLVNQETKLLTINDTNKIYKSMNIACTARVPVQQVTSVSESFCILSCILNTIDISYSTLIREFPSNYPIPHGNLWLP
jgi:hypothetical protein